MRTAASLANFSSSAIARTPQIPPFGKGRMVGAFFTLGIVYIFRSPLYLVPLETYSLSPSLAQAQGAERDRAFGEALRHVQELHDQGKLSDEELKHRREQILNSNH